MKHLIKFKGLNGEPCYVFRRVFKKRIEKIKSLDPSFIGTRLSDGRKVTPALVYKCLYCWIPEYDKIAQGIKSYYNFLSKKELKNEL